MGKKKFFSPHELCSLCTVSVCGISFSWLFVWFKYSCLCFQVFIAIQSGNVIPSNFFVIKISLVYSSSSKLLMLSQLLKFSTELSVIVLSCMYVCKSKWNKRVGEFPRLTKSVIKQNQLNASY